jgi:hypothetical protein
MVLLHCGMLDAVAPDGNRQSALKMAIARAQKKLETSVKLKRAAARQSSSIENLRKPPRNA